MKLPEIYSDGFEAGLSSAMVGTGTTFFGISSMINQLDKIVPADTILTTAQVIELIGTPTLTGILGCAIGAILGNAVVEHYTPILQEAKQVVNGIDFARLPESIGNGKGTGAMKVRQIAQAIERKAHQIANCMQQKYRQKYRQKSNDTTLTKVSGR